MIQENVLKNAHIYPLLMKQSIYVLVTVQWAILLMNQPWSVLKSVLKVNLGIILPTIVLIHVHPIQNTLEILYQENVFFTVLTSFSQMPTIIDNAKNIV